MSTYSHGAETVVTLRHERPAVIYRVLRKLIR
jgi:hypothetical protein